jgi:hypothetical protein
LLQDEKNIQFLKDSKSQKNHKITKSKIPKSQKNPEIQNHKKNHKKNHKITKSQKNLKKGTN